MADLEEKIKIAESKMADPDFYQEDPSAFDPRKYLTPARELVKETVKHKMVDVFGSSNKI